MSDCVWYTNGILSDAKSDVLFDIAVLDHTKPRRRMLSHNRSWQAKQTPVIMHNPNSPAVEFQGEESGYDVAGVLPWHSYASCVLC